MNVKIGQHIKLLRKRDDVTQERLAEALGVTSQAISKWETENGYPDIEYIVAIANFFNVTLDELCGHEKAAKERKILEYCEKIDDMHRNWEPIEERIVLIRQALAEYPADEKLLVRLTRALWEKWSNEDFDRYTLVDGKCQYDFEKCRAHKGWEETAKILEELLATSVDDAIRSECRNTLIRLYGAIGEKEKVYVLAEHCQYCKDYNLFAAFAGRYDEKARICSQRLLQHGLWLMRVHLPRQTKDIALKAKATEKIIELYRFIFSDGNYEFYHAGMKCLYTDYAEYMIQENRMDDALSALEKSFEHAKGFDAYLDKLRKNGKVYYTSIFADSCPDVSEDVYGVKMVPELLNKTLLDKNDMFYKKLHHDARFVDLITRMQNEIKE